MFFGITQTYCIDIYRFYFEEYMLGYLELLEPDHCPGQKLMFRDNFNK